MLFLGHFTFDQTDEDGVSPRFGHFTCIVEVETPDECEHAFRKLIVDMRNNGSLFGHEATDVFCGAFIEVGEIPKSGLVTWYTSYNGDALSSISTWLPHDERGGCKSYYYSPDNRPDINDDMWISGKEITPEPFIRFVRTDPPSKTPKKKAAGGVRPAIVRGEIQTT